jgi:hypothetical protein
MFASGRLSFIVNGSLKYKPINIYIELIIECTIRLLGRSSYGKVELQCFKTFYP